MGIGFLVAVPLLLGLIAWASAALWIDGPSSRLPGRLMALVYAATALALLLWVRPLIYGVAGAALLSGGVYFWWTTLRPRSDRNWEAPLSRTPRARLQGDEITVENVRCFEYRTPEDFDERWETRHYRWSQLQGMDLFLSYWGPRWIAHMIASWRFENAPPLAISIEVRKQAHEEYSAIESFFRRFELHYVAADERDLVRLRTHGRGEDVYLYPLKIEHETAKGLLLEYLTELNELADAPRWYNAATRNCTTASWDHVRAVTPGDPWNWRILLNGHLDELGYERGLIHTGLPFETLRERSAITARAQALPDDADFSRAIREGLPGEAPDPIPPTPP
ncbi:MAG: DUF4105 domain-containing protein [Myxococcota bacterium]